MVVLLFSHVELEPLNFLINGSRFKNSFQVGFDDIIKEKVARQKEYSEHIIL